MTVNFKCCRMVMNQCQLFNCRLQSPYQAIIEQSSFWNCFPYINYKTLEHDSAMIQHTTEVAKAQQKEVTRNGIKKNNILHQIIPLKRAD